MLHKHTWSHSNRDGYLAVDEVFYLMKRNKVHCLWEEINTFKINNKIILDLRSAMIITKQSDMIEDDRRHGLKWASL